jgi:hypothetical protein
MKQIIILIVIQLFLTGCTATKLIAKETKQDKITILEEKSLSLPRKNGIPFEGVSDLAFDKKTSKLYMVGDRGYLYKFDIKITPKKIEKLKYLDALHIKTPKGKVIKPDIEGLTIDSKNRLIASFERKPRVKILNRDGKLIKNIKLPKILRAKYRYRGRNKMLEAVCFHPKYGILTSTEYPIRKYKKRFQTIYSLKGKKWHFLTQKYKHSAVTAIEVMDDGNILVLERAYNGLTKPFFITLKKIYLNRCNKKNICKTEVLATLSSKDGWGYNNFEGLTRVGKNRYLMVSDNNGHYFLSTVLAYFRVDE